MKILDISDLHLRKTNPINRLDNYEESLFLKLDEIFNVHAKKADVIVFAGDIFDSYNTPRSMVGRLIEILLAQDKEILVVYGQHDIAFRSPDLSNTGLGLLLSSKCVKLLIGGKPYTIDDVDFYGGNFENEIPKVVNKDQMNILLLHEMIIKSEQDKIWEGQVNYASAKNILKKNDFDVIFSGDNHKSFTEKYEDKILINAGSVMRNTIGQKDHKPKVVLFDTDTYEVTDCFLKVKPFDEVFDLENHEKIKETNQSLKELSDLLKSNTVNDMDFKGQVIHLMEKEEDEVKDIIGEVFNV